MAEGQYSGRKRSYLYTSDTNETYVIRRDETLGSLDGTGLPLATNAAAGGRQPVGMKLRGVHWQGVLNGRTVRKFIICNRDGDFYSSGNSVNITIDGVAGATTGRRGESLSYVRLEDLVPGNP